MPYGMGPWSWLMMPYLYWGWDRCRWFPWLPRWWWMGIYSPMASFAYGYPWLSKGEELRFLEDQAKFLEEQLNDIKKRIEELKK